MWKLLLFHIAQLLLQMGFLEVSYKQMQNFKFWEFWEHPLCEIW